MSSYVRTHARTHARTHVFIHVHMPTPTSSSHARTGTYKHRCIHARTHARTRTHTDIHAHVCKRHSICNRTRHTAPHDEILYGEISLDEIHCDVILFSFSKLKSQCLRLVRIGQAVAVTPFGCHDVPREG